MWPFIKHAYSNILKILCFMMIWSGSTLFATHSAVIRQSTGSQIDACRKSWWWFCVLQPFFLSSHFFKKVMGIFFMPPCIHLSLCQAISFETTGWILPNLLHHFPRAALFFYSSIHPSSVHLSVTLSPPKSLGGIQPNLLHHFPSWLECARATLLFRVSIHPYVRHTISY